MRVDDRTDTTTVAGIVESIRIASATKPVLFSASIGPEPPPRLLLDDLILTQKSKP